MAKTPLQDTMAKRARHLCAMPTRTNSDPQRGSEAHPPGAAQPWPSWTQHSFRIGAARSKLHTSSVLLHLNLVFGCFCPSEPAVTGHRQHATVVAPPPTAQEPSARPSRTSTPDSLLDLGRRRATQQQLRPRRRALQHLRADQSSCLGQRPRMTCEATAPSAHVTLTTTSPLKKPRAQLGSAQRAAYKGPMRDSDTSPRSAASSISSMSSSRIAVPTGEHLTQAD